MTEQSLPELHTENVFKRKIEFVVRDCDSDRGPGSPPDLERDMAAAMSVD